MREATREPFGWRYGSEFQPTLPMRGATCCSDPCDQAASISTHAPHAGSDEMCARIRHRCLISTHAPHAGSDVAPTPTPQPTTISTHAPHAGSDADNVYNAISAGQFQPTLPMRGATNYKPHYWRFCRFQPTLPMRGATSLRLLFFLLLPISTHAPHAGSDCFRSLVVARIHISTHAPHAGSDPKSDRKGHQCLDFNPRSPCGERLRGVTWT